MRCKACDAMLNEYDMKRKDKASGEFIDLCGACNQSSETARFAAEEQNFLAQEGDE